MGHERVGYLPKTKKWTSIVGEIASFSESNNNVKEISYQTTKNVRSKFKNIEADNGVQSAFEFLVLLSILPKKENWNEYLNSKGIKLKSDFSLIELAQSAKRFIEKNQDSKEYSTFASQALLDTISHWVSENNKQQSLFFDSNKNPIEIWTKSADGSGFCELSRVFFSKFTERYLKYFLERETVTRINNIFDLSAFNKQLEAHISEISTHAFETSKITQSFAAGWYNKNVRDSLPSKDKIKGFLSVAFQKLNSEILREEQK
jgi:hypothetical protein